MPIQPSPRAVTSKLLFPSVPFFMGLAFCFYMKVENDLPLLSRLVLFVADLLHPVDGLAVELFLDGDVRHGRGCRGTVPMLLTRRKPDHVTRPNFLNRAPPALYQPTASRHDQGLTQRVGVPCRAGAWLERDTGAAHPCWIGCLEQGVNAYSAGKVLGRSFAGRLGATSCDVHVLKSST